MKKRAFYFLFSLIVVLSWCPAHADFINVVSQEYSISGYAHYYFNDPRYPEYGSPFTVSFQETSSLPVSQHTVWPSGSYTGYAYAEASSGGGVTSNYAWVECYAYLDDMGNARSGAFASATMTFSPLVSAMLISANRMQSTEIKLIDLTSGLTLYSYSGFYDSESILLSLDLSHIYAISTETDVDGSGGIDFGGSLTIESVPEPTTLLLLGFGLIGLAGIRYRFRH